MQKLSKRLQAAADFVTKGNRAADIGTDHGFLPIYLVQSGKCPRAVAMDIRKGPLERAKEHIAVQGLGALIETRLSDGMQALKAGEADSAIITGMGGLTVIHILEEAREILPDFKELVLEPQSDIAKVRRYLREHKMEIDREELVEEAGKFYPILHVSVIEPKKKKSGIRPRHNREGLQTELADGRQRMYEILLNQLGNRERVQALLDQYGGCVVCGKHPLLRRMLERDEQRALTILQSLHKGLQEADGQQGRMEAAQMRRQEVERRLEEIRILWNLIH